MTIDADSATNPSGISITGVRAEKTSDTSGDLDIVNFKMATPNFQGGNLAYYFGYFDGSVNIDTSSPNPVSADGSLLQIVASFFTIFGYLDKDGSPGFQYSLGDDFFDCSVAGQDCTPPSLSYDLKAQSWTAITKQEIDCSGEADADPDVPCKVIIFSTSTTDGVATFNFKTATQAVLVDNVELTPDYTKFDIEIMFPWDTLDAANQYPDAKVGLYAASAGMTATGSVDITTDENGGTATASYTANGLEGFFNWDGSATVDNAGSTTYFFGLSGSTITAFDCTNCSFVLQAVVAVWKTAIAVWNAFSWNVELIFFSWNDTRPTRVFWDPKMGMKAEDSGATSSATALAAVPTLALAAVVFALFR